MAAPHDRQKRSPFGQGVLRRSAGLFGGLLITEGHEKGRIDDAPLPGAGTEKRHAPPFWLRPAAPPPIMKSCLPSRKRRRQQRRNSPSTPQVPAPRRCALMRRRRRTPFPRTLQETSFERAFLSFPQHSRHEPCPPPADLRMNAALKTEQDRPLPEFRTRFPLLPVHARADETLTKLLSVSHAGPA